METVSLVTQADYYLDRHPALYYVDGVAAIGQWYGPAAAKLGFCGAVTPEQLRRAFAGLSADGLRSLVQVQSGKVRQPAWDLTFSAPKWLSALWCRLDEFHRRWLEDILLRAVKRALDYIDADALNTRRGNQGGRVEAAQGVYVLFLHGTSRALDPQLHVHALAVNLCLRSDGTTGTIRSRDLYWHKMAAGALFRAELAHLLATELGLTIVPDGWKFKIAGVPDSLCEEFSQRRKKIELLAKEEGWSSAAALAKLAVASRPAKRNVPLAECFAHWAATADKHGFTQEAALKLLAEGRERLAAQASGAGLTRAATAGVGQARRESPKAACTLSVKPPVEQPPVATSTAAGRETAVLQAFLDAVDALASFKSHFPERDLVRETATRALACGASASEVLAAVKQGVERFEHRIEIKDSNYASYSTKENVAAEKELLERAYQGAAATKHLVPQALVEKAIARGEQSLARRLGVPVSFTEDQRQAIRHVTQEAGDLKLVQGYAGTGKTQMLAAAKSAWEASGYRVLGAAVTGRAALGLEKATAIPSVTIEFLLRRLRPQLTSTEVAQLAAWHATSAAKSVFYEGIRAGKWMRNPLLQAARETAAGVGKLLAGSERAAKLPACLLTDKTILVVDEAAMLPTKTLLALQQECRQAGAKLVLAGDPLQLPAIEAGAPFQSLAARLGQCSLTSVVRQKQPWMREATSLLIANQPQQALECYAANGALRLARHHRAAMDKLIADYGNLPPQKFAKAIALTATNAEARLINQGVQAKRKALQQLGRCSVQLPNGERVHAGDRVMLTLNDYRLNVRNGMLATVLDIERPRGLAGRAALKVQLDDFQERGFLLPKLRTLVIDLKDYPDVQIGYAATTHKIQGITVDTSFVLVGDVMLSKERAFTQLTRASHESTLYAAESRYGEPLQLLAQQISKQTAKDLAHDHGVVRQPQSEHQRRQGMWREAVGRLLPPRLATAVGSSAALADVKLSASQVAAQWRLMIDYGRLRPEQFSGALGIVTNAAEASRINRGVQQRRKTSHQLGVDAMRLPNGEQVHRGDRVLVSVHDAVRGTRTVLGTVNSMQFGRGVLANASVTVELDGPAQASTPARGRETVTVAARDFPQLQLGYAATAAALRGAVVESAYVLLPEGGRTPETIQAMLNAASKNVSLYGVQAYYGPQLDAGQSQAARQAAALNPDDHQASAYDARRGTEAAQQQRMEQHIQQQRKNDEQLQLSWQQSFTL